MAVDSISDYIIKMKNAANARKEMVSFPYSSLKAAITDVLEKEGYIKLVSKKGKKGAKLIDVKIVYDETGMPKLKGVQRISKPSKRMYQGASEIRPVVNGYGRLILSTSKGILTDKEARKQKLGGEMLFKIW